ncbi:EAL domain-containing protein [Methylovirgula sp. 4M-Z18]|uniref:EAL domain-containing protein n=1 Tax=Methylovirgula sp. 4M-Z18 TaxID=2293567 RepID=UPI00131465E4|nr:EAL domain-containing protein [Methylovirgula sp. 4M-Z18]
MRFPRNDNAAEGCQGTSAPVVRRFVDWVICLTDILGIKSRMNAMLSNIACDAGDRGLRGRRVEIRIGFATEPVVNLLSQAPGEFYGECLARVMVGDGACLTGGDFVSRLEASASIASLDLAILDLVLDALQDDRGAVLGCNISPNTLADRAAWDKFVRSIAHRPELAKRLILEITESSPLNEILFADKRLAEVQSLGCRIAIDDFGARYAMSHSLYGLNVEWDIIKIDRSCFGDLRERPSGCQGLRSVISLASCLAPTVVVEGIETKQHLAAARDCGARYGQGWLFEAPVRECWKPAGDDVGGRLAAALIGDGAILYQPARSVASRSMSGAKSDEIFFPRVGDIRKRIGALISRGLAGGRS